MTIKEDEKSERSKRSPERVNFVMVRLTARKEAWTTNLERKEAGMME
jgi:hypothetical protein